MSAPIRPCRVDEVAGWCREHDAKARLLEEPYCDKNPIRRAPSDRERLVEKVVEAAIEDKQPRAHSANLTYALAALQAHDAKEKP